MKNSKYLIVRTVPNFNKKILETEAKSISLAHIPVYINTLSWVGTGTLIKSGRVKLVLWIINLFQFLPKQKGKSYTVKPENVLFI